MTLDQPFNYKQCICACAAVYILGNPLNLLYYYDFGKQHHSLAGEFYHELTCFTAEEYNIIFTCTMIIKLSCITILYNENFIMPRCWFQISNGDIILYSFHFWCMALFSTAFVEVFHVPLNVEPSRWNLHDNITVSASMGQLLPCTLSWWINFVLLTL